MIFNVPPSLLKNKPLEWVIKYSVPASGVVIGCAFTAVHHKSTNEKSKNNLAFIIKDFKIKIIVSSKTIEARGLLVIHDSWNAPFLQL